MEEEGEISKPIY